MHMTDFDRSIQYIIQHQVKWNKFGQNKQTNVQINRDLLKGNIHHAHTHWPDIWPAPKLHSKICWVIFRRNLENYNEFWCDDGRVNLINANHSENGLSMVRCFKCTVHFSICTDTQNMCYWKPWLCVKAARFLGNPFGLITFSCNCVHDCSCYCRLIVCFVLHVVCVLFLSFVFAFHFERRGLGVRFQ